MKKRNSVLIAIMLISVIGMLSSGGTLAYAKIQGNTINKVTVASVRGQIVEEYEQNPTVFPGGTVDKVVNVKNTGSIDSVVRVKVTKAWGSRRDALGKLVVDEAISADNILIDYNTEMWIYDDEDGYFYYKGVLTPGSTTVQPLFTQYTLAQGTGNEYKNKTADIVIQMECIQAGGNGISAWGKTFDDLGVEYSAPAPGNTDTYIEFDGSSFTFGGEAGDLFADFKNLIPGETRSQLISVNNTSSAGAELWLKASLAEQTQATPETEDLIDKLIKEYLTVTVTDGNGNLIYSGPVYGNVDTEKTGTETMKSFISLGNFDAGDEKELTVSLGVSSELDNDYRSLLGLIEWNLEAENTETTTTTTATSSTTTTTAPSTTTTTAPSTTTTTAPSTTTTTAPSTTTTTAPSIVTTTVTSPSSVTAIDPSEGLPTTPNPTHGGGTTHGGADVTSPGTTTRRSDNGGTPLPDTGSTRACYIVFFVSAFSFVVSLAAYVAGIKKDKANA